MLPQAFLQRMEEQLGEEYPAFLESFNRPRAVGLRANPLKGALPPLPFGLEPVPWARGGYWYDPATRPGLHPWHQAGLYYLQEPSAMAPVTLLDPRPGERVLDLCAAPGGKSTQIAGLMENSGLLVSNEYSPKRAKILSQNLERLGAANALVLNEPVQALADRFPGWFHRVLVDAPCSGEGMFRKEAAALEDWSPELVDMCARRQGEILEAAARLTAPGGRLVYSTCTFSPREDEEAVAAFLEGHREFTPIEPEAPWFVRSAPGCFRLWPHRLRGEGHFAAVLEKAGGEAEAPEPEPPARFPREAEDFLRELGILLPPGKALAFGDTWYWAPEALPRLRGLKVLRPGLELGTCRNGRFLPAHALALWLKEAVSLQELTLEDTARYLEGQTLPTTCRGWTLVRAQGYSIGWAKASGGVLKNHYPKGLRIRR